MGKPLFNVFPEIREQLKPILDRVIRNRELVLRKDRLVILKTADIFEEHYFNASYSPVEISVRKQENTKDELYISSNVVGVYAVMLETTNHVISARRLATLRETSQNTGTYCLFIIIFFHADFF